MDINKLRLLNKTSYLIASSDKFNSTDEFLDSIALELENGIDVIELRENCSAKKFIEHGKRIRELCSIYNALFIVHDRIDIAQITHADGVLLPINGIDIHNARELLGENTIVGIEENPTEEIYNADFIICSKTHKNSENIHYFSNVKNI